MDKNLFRLDSIEMHKKRVLRDAIHDYIQVDHLIIWKLINSKEVQRLRRIKQLGGTYQVFQSAEHSRFVHSLGVYQIIKKMLETECLESALNDYEKLTVMCAGLLHDIGHGPFSHSFEGVFHGSHEDMSVKVIVDPHSEVNQILSTVHENLAFDVASIINHTHHNNILISMVSSQLDADRMDYLLRDSYMTGTTYGHFDLSRVLRTMRICDGKLVYKESGVQAIENYILARYHMYWQVYYHPTARSYEHLLRAILLRIKDLYNENYQFKTSLRYLIPFLDNRVEVEDFYCLDESILLYIFRELTDEHDVIISDLTKRFLDRRLFKYVKITDANQIVAIQDLAFSLGYDPRYYINTDTQTQVPYLHYGKSGELNDIQILCEDGHLEPLPSQSEIVDAIIHSKKTKQDSGIFFPKEIKKEYEEF